MGALTRSYLPIRNESAAASRHSTPAVTNASS
jgi:hypothetical protein